MRFAAEVVFEEYSFGRLRVDGETYSRDLILSPGGVIDASWWRREGHSLDPADLDRAVAARPRILIVGTGFYGRMEVPEATRTWLRSRGIELRALPTADAVRELDRLQGECADLVAALHLSC
ncbi:MAG: MTH938/NDUFAF3 family protein [Chromatiales bacterium]|jgi:hypothetical protein